MSLSRREFMKKAAACGAAAYGLGILSEAGAGLLSQSTNGGGDVALVKGDDIRAAVRKSVEILGGMAKFVHKGETVVVKPNMAWDRTPEQAANTNPELVAEVIKMCLEVGAKKVKVFDRTCNRPERCYLRSGIQMAAEEAGAEVSHIHDRKFELVPIHDGEILKEWEFYRDALEADAIINVPILKSHTASRATIGFKNIMGLLGGDRGKIHTDFDTKIVDINMVIAPRLTIVDAYRILLRNGPSGGNLADVKIAKTIVAGADRVAVDAMGAQLFGVKPEELDYLKIAQRRGMGEIDLRKVNIQSHTLEA